MKRMIILLFLFLSLCYGGWKCKKWQHDEAKKRLKASYCCCLSLLCFYLDCLHVSSLSSSWGIVSSFHCISFLLMRDCIVSSHCKLLFPFRCRQLSDCRLIVLFLLIVRNRISFFCLVSPPHRERSYCPHVSSLSSSWGIILSFHFISLLLVRDAIVFSFLVFSYLVFSFPVFVKIV